MGDNSENIDGAVIMLILNEWQINIQKILTAVPWHGNSVSQNRMYNVRENVMCCRVNLIIFDYINPSCTCA